MAVKRKSWIQPSDAARYFDVAASTIRKWISDGKLRAARLPTGHVRILTRDVVKCLLQQGKAVPPELGNLGNKHVLIVDPDKSSANTVAGALRSASGCKVTVAESAVDAKGMLNGSRPDLVLIGVRHAAWAVSGNGARDLLILAGATDESARNDQGERGVAFELNEILLTPVDEQTVVSRVANVLLG